MTNLVRRAPSRPLVWLGDKESASSVVPLGERFPAYPVKEKDLLFDVPPRRQR